MHLGEMDIIVLKIHTSVDKYVLLVEQEGCATVYSYFQFL